MLGETGYVNGSTIYYHMEEDGVAEFRDEDFQDLCRRETGYGLGSIRFSLPSSRRGTLYYRYKDPKHWDSKVSEYQSYTVNGLRHIDDVSFVSTGNYGNCDVAFEGWSSNDQHFSGTVRISAWQEQGELTVRYLGYGQPVQLRSQDFVNAAKRATGGRLASIGFVSLPDPAVGTLYLKPGGIGDLIPAQSQMQYGAGGDIDSLYFLPKAGFKGLVQLPYEGLDTQGRRFRGRVEVEITPAYVNGYFTDLVGWGWAADSIEYLRTMGITQGYSDGTFRPGRSITRGEFTLMVCRAFHCKSNGASGFPDVPQGSVYASSVAAARELGVIQGGADGKFHPTDPITRQGAMTMIYRALRAAGRELPTASTTVLTPFKDKVQVAPYARAAVASMVEQGIVQGSVDKRLKPEATISRAEMAVILHRSMTH